MLRTPRAHNKAHLDFIRGLPCLICEDNTSTEAAHIRYHDLTAGKRQTGKGEKPDDGFTVPLCGKHHRDQHRVNEARWWIIQGIDPIRVSLSLWKATGNHELGCQIVAANARMKTPIVQQGPVVSDVRSTIAGLRAQECPGGGWSGQPAEIEEATVADCLAHGVCGCIYGDAVRHLETMVSN